MQITKLVQSKKQNLVQIFIDEEFAASINKNTLVKFQLHQGLVITHDLWLEILNKDLFVKLYYAAIKQIASRPRTLREMQTYLKSKIKKLLLEENMQDKILDDIINKLIDEKYLDDSQFAKWLIDNRLSFKGKGRAELEAELYAKGVAREVINDVLSNQDFSSIEVEIIKKDALKKFHVTNMPKDRKLALKISSYFLRRGFGYDKIKAALVLNQ